MTYQWTVLPNPENNPEHSYLLTVDGKRAAVVWWIGGHVDRPDSWHVNLPDSGASNHPGFESARGAMMYAEMELKLRPDDLYPRELPQKLAAEGPTDELVMYLAARKDLKMGPGKLAAQVGHGVQYSMELAGLDPRHKKWLGDWQRGKSHTKIVLALNSEEELVDLHQRAYNQSVPVKDEGRTEVEPGSLTVLAFVPMPRAIAKLWVGHLPLYR